MHQLTYVLVRDTRSLEQDVGRLLAGSASEPTRTFRSRLRRCSCVGWLAESRGLSWFDATERGRAINRDLAQIRSTSAPGESALLEERLVAAHRYATQQPDFGLPDPECEVCSGTGEFLDSMDPAGRCDWWLIGGRWTGLFAQQLEATDSLGNVAPFVLAVSVFLPAVVVTPNGEWHASDYPCTPDFLTGAEWVERRRLELEPWRREIELLISEYGNYYAVVVDCHS